MIASLADCFSGHPKLTKLFQCRNRTRQPPRKQHTVDKHNLLSEEPISKKHDRKSFDYDGPAMNDFFERYARQSHESGAAKTFLAIDDAGNKSILGFYSLAPGALAHADTPEMFRRGLARHDVPRFRLARIAIDVRCQGQGIGGQLLAAAARRCLRASAEVGGVVFIIDAKNDRAARWYASYGAVPLGDQPLTLVMSLASFAADLKAAGKL